MKKKARKFSEHGGTARTIAILALNLLHRYRVGEIALALLAVIGLKMLLPHLHHSAAESFLVYGGLTHNLKHRERIRYTINTPLIHEIVLGGYIQQIRPILAGQVVVSAGTANGTSLGENPGNLLSRLVVEGASAGAYPDGYLRRMFPRTILRRRIYDYGWLFTDTALSGAAGTFQLNQPYAVDFAWPNIPRPVEASLNTNAYTALQLRLETGSRDTQFSGNDRTFDFTGAFFDIADHRESSVPDPSGNTSVTYEDDTILNISGANSVLAFTDLPAGADYMSLFVVSETTNQALADTIVNRMSVDFGQVGNYDLFQKELKAFGRDHITDAAADLGLASAAPQSGTHLMPLNKDGLLSGAIPVRQNKQAKILFDVSNPGTDRLVISSRRVLTPAEFLRVA